MELFAWEYPKKLSKLAKEPGIHMVKLVKLQRQFLFMVPKRAANPDKGTPAFMFFHGVFQTPFFSVNILGLPDLLEHYGWFGILPYGKPGFVEVDSAMCFVGPLLIKRSFIYFCLKKH